MNRLTFGDLKDSELPAHLNLCPTDPRFTTKVNRALEWLMNCGSFRDTVKPVLLCVDGGCFVTPPFVANVEAIRACHRAARIENDWYRMLPGFNPIHWEWGELWFEYRDQVPSARAVCAPRVLRSFAATSTDYGKSIKFLGYDKNRQWVRTLQGGVMQDGELVFLSNPFADTVTEWTSVTAVLKAITDAQVTVFSHPFGDDTLTLFGAYQHWETQPSYQRYRIHNRRLLEESQCCPENVIEAQIKLCHIPVSQDDDILPINNRVGLELAVMGVKALDDGDLARADLLLFGDTRNKRIGAVPLLNQQVQTETGDRFAAHVRIGGPCGFKAIMRGML